MDFGNGTLFASAGSPWGYEWGYLYDMSKPIPSKIDSTTTNAAATKFSLLFCIRRSTIITFTNGIITNTISDGGSLNPNSWSRELTTRTFFRSVFRQSERNVFASGQWNLLFHYNGFDWKQLLITVPNHTVSPQALFGRVWSDGNEVFVCDYDNGIVYHGR
ncbi:MAG: hypothetical protein HY961_04460 [Ignavibacteriae bacterium]|nr:hypothetical protein [Ignavibacteriota bacterium]